MGKVSMTSMARRLAAVLIGFVVATVAGCKDKEPEPERPKISRKLPLPK
jgi:hypothetical protein